MPRRLAPLTTLLVSLACAPAALAGGPPPSADFGLSHRPVCPAAGQGFARCHAHVVVGPNGKPQPSLPAYGAGDLQSAYGVSSGTYNINAPGPTIAVVDAFDDTTAEVDLAAYRGKYELGECSTSNGCFSKVDQRGSTTSHPPANEGWAQEISLDLDMASAICPSCKLLLVETDDNGLANLGAGVSLAGLRTDVVAISNSYGSKEFSTETNYEGPYSQTGKAVTVSSGDAGYGVEFPASSRYVTAVGGTSLKRASNTRGWSETAWSGAGSGCSAYVPRPGAWQTDPICTRRAVADVSAVADPATGVEVRGPSGGTSQWLKFGGTSAAAPIIAGVYARANTGLSSEWPYTHVSSTTINDVTSGTNGRCRTKLCTAVPGWDGPTGLGTPAGTAAF